MIGKVGLTKKERHLSAQSALRADLEKALVLLWRDHGVNLVHLGRLERVEYHAFSTLYDLMIKSN